MKTIFVNIGVLALAIHLVSAQGESGKDAGSESELKDSLRTKQGIEYSRFFSASGYQEAYEVHFTTQSSARAKVGFGLFMDNESKKISGLSLTYQRFFFSKRDKQPLVQPFLFYNFIYRKTKIPALFDNSDVNKFSGIVTYTSLEHHVGFGLSINILKSLVLGSNFGYGIYLGSIKKPSEPDPITKEISGTNGAGWLFKTGIGFTF